jgi:hypothetical protein
LPRSGLDQYTHKLGLKVSACAARRVPVPRAGWVKPRDDQRLTDHVALGVLTRTFPPGLWTRWSLSPGSRWSAPTCSRRMTPDSAAADANAEARGRAGEPGMHRRARGLVGPRFQNPSADRCLSPQLAAPFVVKPRRALHYLLGTFLAAGAQSDQRCPGRAQTGLLRNPMMTAIEEPDERDGADPSG